MSDETGRAIDLLERNESLGQQLVARLADITSNQQMMLARLAEMEKVPLYLRLRLQEALKRSEDAYDRVVILRRLIPKLQNLRIIPTQSGYQPAKVGTNRAVERTASLYFIP